MNTLAKEILKSVAVFRQAVGFGVQENSVHESLYASESIEFLISNTNADMADALADMAVVMAGHQLAGKPFYDFEKAIDGLFIQAEINRVELAEAFKIVMISNMSKVCHKDDIYKTNAKYAKEGVSLNWVERGNGLWACYSAKDYPDKPKGKLLEPVSYVKPDWSGDGWKL